jgi:hypothetical protein
MGENILRITTYAVLRILALVSHGENIKETHSSCGIMNACH